MSQVSTNNKAVVYNRVELELVDINRSQYES